MTPSTTNTAARELSKIGELIRVQDNRITDQPIFIVQQKRRIAGLTEDYASGYEWRYDGAESSYDDAAKAERDAERAEDGSPPLDWYQVGYIDIWEFVTACFTEQGCKDYLAINGHNLREPRIYAEGSFRNNEFRMVRDYLSTLTQQQGGEQEARELLAAEYELDDPDYAAYLRASEPVDLIDDDARAIRAIQHALRTKQPAASEGDVNAAASNLNIAARYAKPEHAKLIVDAISLLRKLAPTNTSKQAAGEAVDLNDEVLVKLNAHGLAILKADHEAFRAQVPSIAEWSPPKTDADGFSRRQLWCLFQDFGPHISLPAKKPFDAIRLPTTPPRHPADEMARDAARWRAMRQTLVAADFAPEMGGGPIVMFACHAERVGFGPEGADAIADAAIQAGAP